MAEKRQMIIAVSGVAGAGKDSIINKLYEQPDKFVFAVSYTDRPKRPGDIDGQSYNFISKEEFSEGIAKGEFLEWETVRGEYRYGRKKKDFESNLASGKIPVLQIDVKGAQTLKKKGLDVVSVFIIPPSLEEAQRRLKLRSSDTPDQLAVRIDRYKFEMSFKDKYDYVLINDDLAKAQAKFLGIIAKESAKRKRKKSFGNILFTSSLVLFTFLALGVGSAYGYSYYQNKVKVAPETSFPPGLTATKDEATVQDPAQAVAPVAPPTSEVKKKISQNKPKAPVATPKVASSSTKNTDGSTTTTVSTGSAVSAADLAAINSSTASISTPLDIPFTDETAKYPEMKQILESYLSSVLKWKTEISAMKQITIRNAGASGWNGQYLGSYTTLADGSKITSASGSIIINTYYIESQYCAGSQNFTGCPDEYAKLFLSHEYGHHYTLYHKWMDWNLPSGVRFPDSYYTTRPLSKTKTATDYSLGWANCESEIIAEDYSYLYSGYGLDAMSGTYGYPSAATKTWLANIGDQSLLNPVVNQSPAVNITSPAEGATLSGTANFSADASDDIAVAKVDFYAGDKLIAEKTAAPFTTSLNTTSFANGSYVLKAVVSDGTLTAEKSITVTFNNAVVDLEKPTITLVSPATNPFTLVSNNLTVTVKAEDNTAVDHIDLYFDDQFQKSWKLADLSLAVSFASVNAGTHTLKFTAYDTAGNSADLSLTIIKN